MGGLRNDRDNAQSGQVFSCDTCSLGKTLSSMNLLEMPGADLNMKPATLGQPGWVEWQRSTCTYGGVDRTGERGWEGHMWRATV